MFYPNPLIIQKLNVNRFFLFNRKSFLKINLLKCLKNLLVIKGTSSVHRMIIVSKSVQINFFREHYSFFNVGVNQCLHPAFSQIIEDINYFTRSIARREQIVLHKNKASNFCNHPGLALCTFYFKERDKE